MRGRTVFYEFAESYAPELLAGAMEELWVPIMDDDLTQPPPSYKERCWPVSGRAYFLVSGETSPLYGLTNPAHSAAERRFYHISIRGAEADIKATGRKINGVWVDALVQLLHSRGRLTESCLLKSNRFSRLRCWLAGPGVSLLVPSTSFRPSTEWPSAYAY